MTNRNNWQTSISVNLTDFSAERMKEFRENDINYMELTHGELEAFENFSEKSKYIFKCANNHGVTIRSVHLPFAPFALFDPASADKKLRDNFLKYQSEILKISAERGAEIIVVHPSAEPYEEKSREMHLNYAIESIYVLHSLAKKSGVILAVENLPRTCMGRNCYDIKKIAAAIPDIHFCFDSNHSLTDKNSDIIKAMGNRIVATHISDYEFIDEMHLLPGEGKNNWQEIISCLEEADYKGTWNYEIRDCSDIPAKIFKENHRALLFGEIK